MRLVGLLNTQLASYLLNYSNPNVNPFNNSTDNS